MKLLLDEILGREALATRKILLSHVRRQRRRRRMARLAAGVASLAVAAFWLRQYGRPNTRSTPEASLNHPVENSPTRGWGVVTNRPLKSSLFVERLNLADPFIKRTAAPHAYLEITDEQLLGLMGPCFTLIRIHGRTETASICSDKGPEIDAY